MGLSGDEETVVVSAAFSGKACVRPARDASTRMRYGNEENGIFKKIDDIRDISDRTPLTYGSIRVLLDL